MGQDSKIEWCHHTANLWWGCVEVSKLCDFCYAREWSKRYDRAKWGASEPRVAVKGVWADLLKYQKLAAAANEIHRVFVGSMMDIFEKSMPLADIKGDPIDGSTDDLRVRLFDMVPSLPNLLLLFLTKRPGNIVKLIPAKWMTAPPANVMFGTSVGDQDTAYEVTRLMQAPGRRFLSCEPMLGPIDLTCLGPEKWDVLRGWKAYADNERGWANTPRIDWLICGGESGPKARAMNPQWARSLRNQCIAAEVPFLFKQWGEYQPANTANAVPLASGKYHDWPDGQVSIRVGKHAAGRMLDGRTWDEFPTVLA